VILTIRDAAETRRHRLPRGRFVIGSMPYCEIYIANDRVSPHHAVLTIADTITIEPQEGRVRVAGAPIEGATEVPAGVAIRLAGVELELHAIDDATAPPLPEPVREPPPDDIVNVHVPYEELFGGVVLTIEDAAGTRHFRLGDGTYTIGGAVDNAIVALGAAPLHARLHVAGHAATLEPVQPQQYPVLVGGTPVATTRLRPDRRVEIGPAVIQVRPDTPADAGYPTIAPPAVPPGNPPAPTRPPQPVWTRPTVWRDRLADDPVEHDFLATLRANPGDAASRMVYADWLEGRGDVQRAGFVRAEPPRDAPTWPPDADWRAITSRAAIQDCVAERCPRHWDGLAATGDERVRTCSTCEVRVRYCASVHDAEYAGTANEAVVFDLALDENEAYWAVRGYRR
jgi:uncharacterized protein (TIGR02996 family)